MATFRIALDLDPIPFEAGQYLTLGLDVGGTLVQRPYSIASSARKLADGYELYVRRVPGGAFTPALFAAGAGDRLSVKRPKGRFVLGPDDGRTHLFVATGCGLAPFISMLRTLHDDGASRAAVVVHGVSYVAEFGYRGLLEGWERSGTVPLHYFPTISRPRAPENVGWSKRTGRVEAQLPSVLDDLGLSPANAVVYLCGNPEMVTASRELLAARGFSADSVHAELYWPAAAIERGRRQ